MKQGNVLWQGAVHSVLFILSLLCLLPFALLFISSVTDEQSILLHGYSFFPEQFSLSAYHYLWQDAERIMRANGITVLVTIIGTGISLVITSLLAYPLSRKDMPAYRFLSFFVVFTMLFNGGLVPTYLVYTGLLDLKNTLMALIVPGLLTNAFYVMLMRTFFVTSVPAAIIESAKIDGAGEFRAFVQIVLPLSMPILATVGLFQTIHYWNDWFNGMVYITDSKLFSLQNLLNRILLDIQFLASSNFGGTQEGLTANIPTETVRMAMAVIGIVPILIAYPFFQKYFVKGLTIGAVKG
ncbi:carbohydrate ABC transporter permease [Paenibacillus sp. J5C_2022]|uniref:carbohydrate ABC transporter permease n=1 Tax=Paenibacillus sp. J5C2022 TaxID=2977129 RepID=UPI0021D09D8C|nr:carbohydrate ABC transporter permease [Paenibacillus sp. J5C2022]MCU6707757.1 carbohydrate ABC transporter permease [Paenibacillus sp. J5C2022]